MAAILVAGAVLGTMLGNFATGDIISRAIAEPPLIDAPLASRPDAQPLAAIEPAPPIRSCIGCDPPPFRRWYEGEQARIAAHLAETDYAPSDAGYGYDRYGNVYYDDGAYDVLAAGRPEHVTGDALAPARVAVAADAPAIRVTVSPRDRPAIDGASATDMD
ncbi:hypothetical protein [Sphingomonas sanxanigenens]|uniref:Uncharacterized protein n=1 Tax=Sphingomonas sanxanigenens DSM 19645 = NX02 TaxID=1123269 RepID=W0ABY0_9SPHN|nr:hypothetical protein [Sphingomonas sanxanigenens]AHE54581.1 hypothetical protein NX02_14480 [Sphingomonas sanxanigenens DSM 19645 = NX02]